MSALQQANDLFTSILQKVRDDRFSRSLAILGGVSVGLIVTRWFLNPKDGKAYMSDDQLAFLNPIDIDTGVTNGKLTRVQRIHPSNDKNNAADVLSNLSTDPMMLACSQATMNPVDRKLAMKWIQNVVLSATLPSSSGAICLRTEIGDAVAVWFPKGGEVNPGTLLMLGAWQFSFRYTGWERRGRLDLWSQAVQPRRKRIMANHHGSYYYLMLVSSRPEVSNKQEQLIAVILPVVQRADAQGVPCYYECTDPSLLPIFTKLGFQEVEDFTFFNVPVHILKRDARVIKG